jgi:hypothetical protein
MSNTTPATYLAALTDAQILAVALGNKRRMENIDAETRVLTAELARRKGEVSGTYTVDGVGSFTISENNTYPEENIVAALTPGQVKRCEVRKVSNALVKSLYPAVYVAAKKSNGFKVAIKANA